ncbi:hypothetical protein [Desulfosporosinus lacus]|uniref:Uncharacterized protein n=1 Tax=Desulfosporosinus lacus DSM 15449 TaxID=1121420 RepID=A0A1M5SBH6_9FIRM|nr:hypothetical protein [Desulfosporosinus lacus]SHH35982.1 hypothetical protein SAMN02746098_00806 [Desulfosporosinus lacus DSM 15449]
MFTIPNVVFANDITRLPKITLTEICTDLNLDNGGSAYELAQRVWEHIRDGQNSENVLEKSKNKLLVGQASLTWFRLESRESLRGSRELVIENAGFNPFEQVKLPLKEQLTTEPVLIAGANGEYVCEYYLRFMYKNGVKKEYYGNEMNISPISEITTVYVNEDLGIIEVRADSKKAEKVASAFVRILRKEITLEQIITPFDQPIDDIADKLNGELIDTVSKPELLLADISADEAKVVVDILASLNEYFNTKDITVVETCLKKADELFDEQTIAVPFTALILGGMERVGLGGERELRGLPLYDCFNPYLDHQSGFIRFSFPDGGVEKPYTVRVGLKSKSIYFNTPANESVVEFVRNRVILV